MRAVELLQHKRDGGELSRSQIEAFVQAAARQRWPDYQLSAMLMAICCRGMTNQETAHLTRAMTDSGERIDLSDLDGPRLDKHSTGGVGDTVSLILAPLAASCGVIVPMMSGRGLGHTGGTLDKLESIPGFRVGLSIAEFRATLRKIGCAMIGQTEDVAPADRTLYALRDVTGTVENVPLITASILSKKLAEGIDGLVLDVKVGLGAFMKTLEEARTLARSLVEVGTANGLRVEAQLTDMESPLGYAVGHTLEVEESIATLRGEGPADLEELSIRLSAAMLRLGGLAFDDREAEEKLRQALQSGRALEKFQQLIELQGGDPRVIDDLSRLPGTHGRSVVAARDSGWIARLDAGKVGRAALALGAGRHQASDAVDHAVGIVLLKKPGDRVERGEAVFRVHHRDGRGLAEAEPMLQNAIELAAAQPIVQPLIIEVLS